MPGAVEAHAIQVRVVRILALLAAGGRDYSTRALSSTFSIAGRHELALGDAVLQRAGVGVVQIEVAPAVALRPEDNVRAVVDEPQRLRLDVGVEPLLDQHLDLAGRGIGDADVELVQVAALAREVQLAGESLSH